MYGGEGEMSGHRRGTGTTLSLQRARAGGGEMEMTAGS